MLLSVGAVLVNEVLIEYPAKAGGGREGELTVYQGWPVREHAPEDRVPGGDETHEKCPRNAFRASRRNARVMVIIVGHGKRAVDEFPSRGHYEVREGVCEGCEGG